MVTVPVFPSTRIRWPVLMTLVPGARQLTRAGVLAAENAAVCRRVLLEPDDAAHGASRWFARDFAAISSHARSTVFRVQPAYPAARNKSAGWQGCRADCTAGWNAGRWVSAKRA